MTTTRRDIVSGAVLGAAAITLYQYVSAFPVREGQSPAISAGFYPRLLAIFLGVLALIQIGTAIVTEIRFSRASSPWTGSSAQAGGDSPAAASATERSGAIPQMRPIWKDRGSFVLFMVTVVALVVYPYLLRILGFAITGFLFVGTLIFALSAERRKGKDAIFIIAITIGIAVLTYVIFRRFLEIPFPTGVFGR